jgi:hypothetical protein
MRTIAVAIGAGFIVLLILNVLTISAYNDLEDDYDRLQTDLEAATTRLADVKIDRDIYGSGSYGGGTAEITGSVRNIEDADIAPMSVVFFCKSYDENGSDFHQIHFAIDERIAPQETASQIGYLYVPPEFDETLSMEIFVYCDGQLLVHKQWTGQHY